MSRILYLNSNYPSIASPKANPSAPRLDSCNRPEIRDSFGLLGAIVFSSFSLDAIRWKLGRRRDGDRHDHSHRSATNVVHRNIDPDSVYSKAQGRAHRASQSRVAPALCWPEQTLQTIPLSSQPDNGTANRADHFIPRFLKNPDLFSASTKELS